MDATEAAALRKLGEREHWGVDELPAGIDVDLLRCLDDLELLEARYVTMINANPAGSGPYVPSRSDWFSPIRTPQLAGPWKQIVSDRIRDPNIYPSEIRLTDRGRAELARLRRVDGSLAEPASAPASPVAGVAGSDSVAPAQEQTGGKRSNESGACDDAGEKAADPQPANTNSGVTDFAATALWASMNALGSLKDNALNFVYLFQHRQRACDAWLEYLAIVAKRDPEKAKALRADIPWLKLDEGVAANLRYLLDNTDAWAERALEALRKGGCDRLCKAEGSRRTALDLATRLQAVGNLTFLLRFSLPGMKFIDTDGTGKVTTHHECSFAGDEARELAEHGTYFREATKRIRAMASLEGLRLDVRIPGWDRSLPQLGPWHHIPSAIPPELLPPALASQTTGPVSSPVRKPKPTRRERALKWLAEAMLLVRDHPEWSDAKIADQVEIDKSRLSRSREYRAAARMARTPKTPNGSVSIADGVRSVEAVDDSTDPNRPPSRQWQHEEDTDDRIDREMSALSAERNAKRNDQR